MYIKGIMINYICERCGYNTYKNSSFKNHLNRKVKCSTIYSNISTEDIIKNLEDSKFKYTCEFCKKDFNTYY